MPYSVKYVVTFNISRLRRHSCATMEDYNSSLGYEIWFRLQKSHYASLFHSRVQEGSAVGVPLVMNNTVYLAYGCLQSAFNCNNDCKGNGHRVATKTAPIKIFLHKKKTKFLNTLNVSYCRTLFFHWILNSLFPPYIDALNYTVLKMRSFYLQSLCLLQ
jgi:hypothetical protein